MMDPLKEQPVGSIAVIFISELSPDNRGYPEMSDRMAALAEEQTGFLGWVSLRGDAGLGITISWWRDRISALEWKQVAEHRLAQRLGSERWYRRWSLQVCTIDESRVFDRMAVEPE